MIDDHSLVVALVSKLHLLNETLLLIDRIVKLGIGISQLLTIHHQLETLSKSGLRAVHLGKRRHLNGIIGNEGWLDEGALAKLTKEFVDQLTLTHGLIYVHTLRKAERTNLVLCLAVAVETSLLLDGIEDRQTTEWSLKRDDVAIDFNLGLAIHSCTDFLQHLLGKGHTPQQVLIADIELHTSELGIVGLVHTLVAEVLAHLVDTLEATYDEALQVKLSGDTHVHILVERIEVGDEWAGRSTTSDVLQNRSVHLRISGVVKNATQGADDGGTLQEGIFHTLVDYQVNIALTIAQLGVVELVVSHTVLVFHDRQGLQSL